MKEILSRCGILCNECPAYQATIENNDELRKKTAEKWSKMYQTEIKPDQINCLGCHSSQHFQYCDICPVRACAIEKQLNHCGQCSQFPCDKEKPIIEHNPTIIKRVERFTKK